jgi:hypothetical protein
MKWPLPIAEAPKATGVSGIDDEIVSTDGDESDDIVSEDEEEEPAMGCGTDN